MPRSLTGINVQVRLGATLRNTMSDGSTTDVAHPALTYTPSMSDGVGDNQANRGWQSVGRTLAAGGSETLDLFDLAGVDIGAGGGRDGVGQLVSPFEEIVGIAITNDNAVTAAGQLEVAPAAVGGWTPVGTHSVATAGAIRGGGILTRVEPAEGGLDVNDGVSHRITLTANGGPVTYSIYLLARHDDETSSSSSSSTSTSSSSSSSTSSSSSSSSVSTSSTSSSTSSSSSSSASSSSSSSSSSISTSSESSSPSSSSWSSPSSVSTSSTSSSSVSTSSASSVSTSSASTEESSQSSSSWSSASSGL